MDTLQTNIDKVCAKVENLAKQSFTIKSRFFEKKKDENLGIFYTKNEGDEKNKFFSLDKYKIKENKKEKERKQ